LSKVGRLTSNQDQNDHRTHVITFHQRKYFFSCVIFVCNYPGQPHVAAAYLFTYESVRT